MLDIFLKFEVSFFLLCGGSHVQGDVAVFRSFKSCIQAQASATLALSVISILRYVRSVPQVVRRAAAPGCCAGLLGSRAAYPSSLKVIVRGSQDRSHVLAFSSVSVGVFFSC